MNITRKNLSHIRLTLASDGEVRLKIPPHYDPKATERIMTFAQEIANRVGVPPTTRRGNIVYGKELRLNWSNTGQAQSRRTSLWLEDPKCRNCGIETILPHDLIEEYGEYASRWPKEKKDRMATLEHMITRFDPRRRTLKRNGDPVTTLFCSKCNNDKGSKDYNSLPLEELRRRAGYYNSDHRRSMPHRKTAPHKITCG